MKVSSWRKSVNIGIKNLNFSHRYQPGSTSISFLPISSTDYFWFLSLPFFSSTSSPPCNLNFTFFSEVVPTFSLQILTSHIKPGDTSFFSIFLEKYFWFLLISYFCPSFSSTSSLSRNLKFTFCSEVTSSTSTYINQPNKTRWYVNFFLDFLLKKYFWFLLISDFCPFFSSWSPLQSQFYSSYLKLLEHFLGTTTPTTTTAIGASWIQQHSVSTFLGHPVFLILAFFLIIVFSAVQSLFYFLLWSCSNIFSRQLHCQSVLKQSY